MALMVESGTNALGGFVFDVQKNVVGANISGREMTCQEGIRHLHILFGRRSGLEMILREQKRRVSTRSDSLVRSTADVTVHRAGAGCWKFADYTRQAVPTEFFPNSAALFDYLETRLTMAAIEWI